MSCRSVISALTLAALACLVSLIFVPAAVGQHGSEGTVTVTVTDPSGSIVPGAHLELRDLGTSVARTADTQGAGTYTFVNLPLGTYRLSISKQGFKDEKRATRALL